MAFVAFALPVSSAFPAPVSAQDAAAPGLTLKAVYDLAWERSPRLVGAQLATEASWSRVSQAGALADPEFMIGVSNLELPSFSATMPMSMAPAMALSQAFPFPGKRGLRTEIAEGETRTAEHLEMETWFAVRRQAGRAFFDLYQAEEQIRVQERAREFLRSAEVVANARYASGTAGQTDVLRASVAVARIDGELRRLEAYRAAAAARLNGILDRPADTPVPPVVPGQVVGLDASRDSLRAWAASTRPLLLAATSEVERSRAVIELSEKGIWPDLKVAVQYGLGPDFDGRTHMGGASVGLNIPLYAGRKQRAAEDEARAEAGVAQARLNEARAMVEGEIGRLLAELERARELVGLYDAEILPQARATVESALSSYRSGGVDFLTLLDAEVALTRFEAELAVLVAEYGAALSDLEATVGRPLPTTNTPLREGS
jgi:outer membrane protein TolC